MAIRATPPTGASRPPTCYGTRPGSGPAYVALAASAVLATSYGVPAAGSSPAAGRRKTIPAACRHGARRTPRPGASARRLPEHVDGRRTSASAPHATMQRRVDALPSDDRREMTRARRDLVGRRHGRPGPGTRTRRSRIAIDDDAPLRREPEEIRHHGEHVGRRLHGRQVRYPCRPACSDDRSARNARHASLWTTRRHPPARRHRTAD